MATKDDARRGSLRLASVAIATCGACAEGQTPPVRADPCNRDRS